MKATFYSAIVQMAVISENLKVNKLLLRYILQWQIH